MPTELYGTLYGHDNLYVVMTMLKDIYAKKPQNVAAAAAGVAQGASAPFTLIHSPTREGTKAPSEGTLEERLSHLTDTLYHLDLDGKPVRKPFKPFITQPRRRFKGGNDRRNFACGWHFNQFRWQIFLYRSSREVPDKEDASDPEDHLESLTEVQQ